MAKIINNVCCTIIVVLWVLYFLVMEVPSWDLTRYLGGITILFYLLPVVVLIAFKFSEYAVVFWPVIILFTIIIFVNHLHAYLLYNHVPPPNLMDNHAPPLNLILAHIIVGMPAFLVAAGYTLIILCIIKSNSIHDYVDPSEGLKEMGGLMVYMQMPFFAAVVATFSAKPMVIYIVNHNYALSVGCEYVFTAFIIALIYFVYETTKIPNDAINYYGKPLRRIRYYHLGNINKYFLIGSSVFAVFSFFVELIFRSHWLIWGQSLVLFFVGMYLLLKFGKILFMPLPVSGSRPKNLYPYLPLMISKKKLLLLVGIVFLYVAVFYVLFG